ncbi:hypothetical protein L596_024795 [Steinernema carpocapsae]|uniref:Uncharacterized protein n=1 Tax=Steinernema carpocapsae TaxID=34508 RepID=A0A4U5M5Z0_STECR|nr:hypothetical protein L596_024795 [Steinernema carpocapsae]
MDSRMLVFAGEPKITTEFFNRIGIVAVTKAGFLIVLLCQKSPLSCVVGIEDVVRSNKVLVLTYYEPKFNETTLELADHVSYDSSQHTSALTIFDSCYAFCYGNSLTSYKDGVAFAQNLKSKSFDCNRAMTKGNNVVFVALNRKLTFDETPSVLRSYALYKLEEKHNKFTTVIKFPASPVSGCATSREATCFNLVLKNGFAGFILIPSVTTENCVCVPPAEISVQSETADKTEDAHEIQTLDVPFERPAY